MKNLNIQIILVLFQFIFYSILNCHKMRFEIIIFNFYHKSLKTYNKQSHKKIIIVFFMVYRFSGKIIKMCLMSFILIT